MTQVPSAGDDVSGTTGMIPAGVAMLAPVFAIPMTVGTGRVVLLPVAVYAAFVLVSLAGTWLLEERYGESSSEAA